jgi:hypothetical protein
MGPSRESRAHAPETRPLTGVGSAGTSKLFRGRVALVLGFALAAALPLGSADAQLYNKPARLMGGSITWAVHPEFAEGVREVEFQLKTALEVDSRCSYTGVKHCPGDIEPATGYLCVRQYGVKPDLPVLLSGMPNLEGVGGTSPQASCDGGVIVKNNFTLTETRSINGINVAHGVFTHSMTIHDRTVVVLANYFSSNTETDSAALRKCPPGLNATLPCAINTEFDADDLPRYWNSHPFQGQAPGPRLETTAPLCQKTGALNCSDPHPSSGLGNYYSPAPGAAVTATALLPQPVLDCHRPHVHLGD